jgi:hypothetical protein
LKQYTDNRAVSLNVDNEWKELKDTILKVAGEVLGKNKDKGKDLKCGMIT